MYLADSGGFLCYESSFWLVSNLLCLFSGKPTGHFSAASVTDSVFYIHRERARQRGGMGGWMDERREGEG